VGFRAGRSANYMSQKGRKMRDSTKKKWGEEKKGRKDCFKKIKREMSRRYVGKVNTYQSREGDHWEMCAKEVMAKTVNCRGKKKKVQTILSEKKIPPEITQGRVSTQKTPKSNTLRP